MNQSRLRVSIVIPAYNEERHLKACLQAIANQTQAPYEVIVVDNNSTDTTANIAAQFPFVRIVHEPQQGIVYARNQGFNLTTGDIIARIDADTRLPANWVASVQSFYAQPGNGQRVLTGGCHFYNLHTGWLTGRGYSLFVHHSNRLLLGYYLPWGSNMALPRAVWQDVKAQTCQRTDIHEDLDLGLHLHRAGYKVQYLSRLRVGAVARRIMTDHAQLWPYLKMWPYTLHIHNVSRVTTFLTWLTTMIVWIGSFGVYGTERIAGLLARKSIDY